MKPIVSLAVGAWLATAWMGVAGEIQWEHLSSRKGQLPVPGESRQQTGAVVGDFDRDGVLDFVLAFRHKPPALVWYRRVSGPTAAPDESKTGGWTRWVIEPEYLTVEAGGAVHDIDGDGDLDIVFGGDWQSSEVWWWENPYPQFDPAVPWKRRTIKRGGARQHHDQVFGDFKGTGRAQLAFWNQQAKTIVLADIPPNPRQAEEWPAVAIFSGTVAGKLPYAEGMSAADIDGDGCVDLLAGNYWFKHLGAGQFKPIAIGSLGGLIFAGQLVAGGLPEVVIAPGDSQGPVKWYECRGNPLEPAAWLGHDLIGRTVIHGHSLQLGDVDGDGYLDVFVAEMAQWSSNKSEPDNPKATAWICFGNGQGQFRKTELVVGHGWHEARLADLDGDGDLDLLNKPYTWDTPRVDVWLNNGTGPRRSSTR
jgi:hypothetical protein